jgi:hypothetical protein
MNYAVDVGSAGIIYIVIFMTINSGNQYYGYYFKNFRGYSVGNTTASVV